MTEDWQFPAGIMGSTIVPQLFCSVDGCDEPRYSKSNSKCNLHRVRVARTGTTEIFGGEERVCPICQDKFVAKTSHQIYCSTRCSSTARGRRHRDKSRDLRGWTSGQ